MKAAGVPLEEDVWRTDDPTDDDVCMPVEDDRAECLDCGSDGGGADDESNHPW